MKRSLLITGCSSGIGLHCAQAMRDAGWKVFAACRREADCARLRATGFHSPRMDYDDLASLSAGLEQVLAETGGKLDAVFNNGAYAIPAMVEDLPTDALAAILQSNVLGWHELTRLVLPIMRAQGHGRIIQNSSVLGFVPMRYRGAYVTSKFALEGLTRSLALEMNGTGIHVIRIQPGPITSRFRANAAKEFDRWIAWQDSPQADLYRETLIPRLHAASNGKDRFELGPEAIAHALNTALNARNPRPRYLVTTPTKLMSIATRVLPDRVLAWVLARN